ncbi:hypothetical protein ACMFMF_000901 [Clarireedia jacksonii]
MLLQVNGVNEYYDSLIASTWPGCISTSEIICQRLANSRQTALKCLCVLHYGVSIMHTIASASNHFSQLLGFASADLLLSRFSPLSRCPRLMYAAVRPHHHDKPPAAGRQYSPNWLIFPRLSYVFAAARHNDY